MNETMLRQRIGEVVEFIARHKGDADLTVQWAVEGARGTLAELERRLATLDTRSSVQGSAPIR